MEGQVEIDKLWKYEDVGKFLQRSPEYIRQDVMRRQIPFLKIGRSVRFDPLEIRAWIESKKVSVRQK